MGEAYYYGKIVFNSAQEAEAAFEDFKALCLEVCKSGDFWQENRGPKIGLSSTSTQKELTQEEFWTEFEKQFPKTADYLKSMEADRFGNPGPIFGGDRNNALAGLLEPIGHEDDVENIHLNMNEIRWSAEVWHFANWDPFCRYVEKKFAGVQQANWLSDEYAEVDYWAMI
jgi:hypothetical protein